MTLAIACSLVVSPQKKVGRTIRADTNLERKFKNIQNTTTITESLTLSN